MLGGTRSSVARARGTGATARWVYREASLGADWCQGMSHDALLP